MDQFEIRDVPLQTVAYGTATCKHSEIGETLARILPAVGRALRAQEVVPAAPPFCRYTDWQESTGTCSLEGGIAVTAPVQETEDLKVGTLGGGKAVYTLHVGPYDQLTKTHTAVMAWIRDNGKEHAGAPWELYITDPGENPDPATWKTEIYWPIL